MRTTIDLPDELHRHALSIARDTNRTLSQTVADLMRRGLGLDRSGSIHVLFRDPLTGLLVLKRGGPSVTTEDVRALEDETAADAGEDQA